MSPDRCEEFCKQYTAQLNRARHEQNASRASYAMELERVEREVRKLIQSIKDGVPGELLKDEAVRLDQRKKELTTQLEVTKEAPVFVHPNMAYRYSVQIQNLIGSLKEPEHRATSVQIVRKLIDKIVLTPNEERTALVIDLIGDLAGILQMTNGDARRHTFNQSANLSPTQLAEIEQIKVVANGDC